MFANLCLFNDSETMCVSFYQFSIRFLFIADSLRLCQFVCRFYVGFISVFSRFSVLPTLSFACQLYVSFQSVFYQFSVLCDSGVRLAVRFCGFFFFFFCCDSSPFCVFCAFLRRFFFFLLLIVGWNGRCGGN